MVSAVSGNVLYQVINLIVQIVGVPLFLQHWGVDYYGEWIILFTIPGYIAISDLGLGTAATTEMSMMLERGELKEINTLLRNTFWFILLIGSIPFLALALSTFVFPWYEWLGFTQISEDEFKWSFILLILYVYISIFMSLPLNYYRVEKKYHRERLISSGFKLFEFATLVFCLMMGYGVIIAATVFFTWRLMMLLFVLVDLRYNSKIFRLLPFSLDYREVQPVLRPGLSLMAFFLGQNFLNQGIITVIGLTLGSSVVVVFSTVRTLVNVVKQLIGTINQAIFSEFSYAMGKRNETLLLQLFIVGLGINIVIAAMACLFTAFFGSAILHAWVGDKIVVTGMFLSLMVLYVFFGSLTNYTLTFVGAVNKFKSLSRSFLVSVILVLIMASVFGKVLGLNFVAALLVGFECIMFILGTKVCLEILGKRLTSWKQVIHFDWQALKFKSWFRQ